MARRRCRPEQEYGLRIFCQRLPACKWVSRGEVTIGIQLQEPILLLLIGHDVDQGRRPGQSISVLELLEEDLHGLSIGRVHRQEVQALGILDLGRGAVVVDGGGHICV